LTLANTRTGVKTTRKQGLRNPLPINFPTRMRLAGFAVEGGGGKEGVLFFYAYPGLTAWAKM